MRAGIFSPNHIGNDAAIFNFVAEQLRAKRGCEVNVLQRGAVHCRRCDEHIILNMCREMKSRQREIVVGNDDVEATFRRKRMR